MGGEPRLTPDALIGPTQNAIRPSHEIDNAPTAQNLAVLAILTAGLLPVTAAQAQWFNSNPSPASLHNVPPGEPYAVEIASDIYAIHHPVVRHGKIQPQESTVTIVHERPVVMTHRRAPEKQTQAAARRAHHVTWPASPRKNASRQTIEADLPLPPARRPAIALRKSAEHARKGSYKPLVIHADAEITILGPDRMSIRLYRKGSADAGAHAR